MTQRRVPWGWLLVAVLVAAAAWGLVHWRKAVRPPPPPAVAAPAEPVVELAASDVVRVEVAKLEQSLPVSGSIRALDTAVVRARVPGELQGLSVREGDAVKAGQVIARIDPVETRARLQQARQQADAAAAQVDIAQRQYDNNRALVDQGFISRTALDTSQSSLAAARATHQAAIAAVDLAAKALDDAVVRAPIAGTISQRLAQPGERLGVDARIVEIVDLRRLEVEAALPPADAAKVRVGQSASLRVEGLPERIEARVARINPSAQAGSRSVPVYLSLAPAPGLRQGLHAEGTLVFGQQQAPAVPLSALRTDKPAPYVQLVEGDRVVHRTVEAGTRGEAGGETRIAVQGVPDGALVLRGHVGLLREGTRVRFTAGMAPNGAMPASATAPAAADAARRTP